MIENKIAKLINYYNNGNYKYVIENCTKLIKKFPNNSPFLYNLIGSTFQKINRIESAIDSFEKVLLIDANNLAAMNNLGNVFKNLKQFTKAETYYKNVLDRDQNYINTLINYGSLKFDINDYQGSIKLYKKALVINGDISLLHYNLGLVYMSLGKNKEAEYHFNEVLRINPKITSADKFISRFKGYRENDPHLQQMLKKKDDDLDDSSKSNLYFALGKAYEDLQDFKKSFKFLEEANNLQKKITGYNKKIDDDIFKNIKESFKNFNFNNNISENNSIAQMIFIVGMPRSGTSLVEQIISSHSLVFGAGELSFLDQSIAKNLKLNSPKEISNTIKMKRVADDYNDLIKAFSTKNPFITDKNPLNFRWIGLIKILYPNAKIIHCKRDAKDNCLSIYKNIFDQNLNWAYNQNDLYNFYKNYYELMNFWKEKMPEFILDVSYEKLINNPKLETKKMLEFCKLNWEDECLNFHNNKRAIKTVSASQARQKIYKTSISSSENFSGFLSDLFSNLEKIKKKAL